MTRPSSPVSRPSSLPVKRHGFLLVVSAPSGAGKTTLCRYLIDIFPEIRQSVSFTTREIRPGEIEGRDYHFIGAERFQQMVDAGDFAEWAEVHGNRYGTSRHVLAESLQAGEDILLDIDCQGAAQLKRTVDSAVFVFILPPSLAELEKRLRGRGTDSEEVIERRLVNARREIVEAHWYDYLVVNADIEQAAEQLKSIVLAERCRAARFTQPPASWYGLSGPNK
ncbi:MAG: guanylate kinase [Deltaproteobacteria bacterium]|nr:MAG: guanylate kinase [Deltaproteobacteria bacterium]